LFLLPSILSLRVLVELGTSKLLLLIQGGTNTDPQLAWPLNCTQEQSMTTKLTAHARVWQRGARNNGPGNVTKMRIVTGPGRYRFRFRICVGPQLDFAELHSGTKHHRHKLTA